jgi:hypothetical protein
LGARRRGPTVGGRIEGDEPPQDSSRRRFADYNEIVSSMADPSPYASIDDLCPVLDAGTWSASR